MYILSNATLVPDALPGLAHRTLAGAAHGLKSIELWSQSIAAGGATPPHCHDCEEVVIVLEGEGVLTIAGEDLPFAAGDTIIVPANAVHRLVNAGGGNLRMLAVFGASPVRVKFPDGTPIDLPWQHPDFERGVTAR